MATNRSCILILKVAAGTHFKVSSLQSGLCRKARSRFTPESCSLFMLKFNSLRWEGLHFRALASQSQLTSDSQHSINLKIKKYYLFFHVINVIFSNCLLCSFSRCTALQPFVLNTKWSLLCCQHPQVSTITTTL